MNDLKIDKLFHDKLTSLEVKPSEGAWNSLEENLLKKKPLSKFWIYSIAASIAIIVGSFVIFNHLGNVETQDSLIAENNSVLSEKPSEEPELKTLTAGKDTNTENESLTNSGSKADLKQLDISIKESLAYIASSNEVENSEIKIIEEEADVVIESNDLITSDVINIEKQVPTIDNTYTRIDPDFQSKPVVNSDLTLPEEDSEIKKIYDYAVRVKNGEETLIDLRKAKDDLFAMAKNIKINQSKTN